MSLKQGVFIVFFGLVFTTVSIHAQTDKLEALKVKREQNLKELKALNKLLFSNQKKEKSVISRIEDINYKISIRENLIKITNEQANLLIRRINANQNEISNLRTQLKVLREDYAEMIVKSYKSKSDQSKVMFLLSSDNFKQAYKRLQYIKQYANYQKEQAEIIKSKTKALQALNIKLTKQKEDKQKLVEDNRKAKAKLVAEENQRKTLMASIRSEMSQYTVQIKKKRQQARDLDKQIDRLINKAIATSNKKAGKTTTGKFVLTPEAKKLASNFQSNKGKLGWPVKTGVIKSRFGKARSLIDSSVEVNNSGVKIATETNAEVKAIFNGKVSKIFVVKNGNSGVMIQHGNYFTIYYNLSKIDVKSGQKITTGQTIGQVFTNPNTGESLLDFRIYKTNQKLNPQSWLAKN